MLKTTRRATPILAPYMCRIMMVSRYMYWRIVNGPARGYEGYESRVAHLPVSRVSFTQSPADDATDLQIQ